MNFLSLLSINFVVFVLITSNLNFTFSLFTNFVIHKNELSEQMKTLALSTVRLEVNNKNSLSNITELLVNTFNNQYGKQWNCIAGPNPLITTIDSQVFIFKIS